MGNINKIVTTLSERPFGKHYFQAFRLMRESILLGGMLTNAESWINITQKDIEELEKSDTILLKKVLESTASKVFMMLELGFVPVRYVLMKKTITVFTLHIKRKHRKYDQTSL